MIKNGIKRQVLSAKFKFNNRVFRFSNGQMIFQGQVLKQKLVYTFDDNYEYSKFYNSEQIKLSNLKKDNFVNRMLLASLFSRIIGSNLPLSIYLNQKVQILKDVPFNIQIEGHVTVAKNLGKNRYLLITEAKGQDINGNKIKYLTGQAQIMLKN